MSNRNTSDGSVKRRTFLGGLLLAGALPSTALAHRKKARKDFPEKFLPQLVNTNRTDWEPGSIHVIPDDFFLFFMLQEGLAIRYGVGVGRKGLYEAGTFTVARKAKWPRWRPTNAMIKREPHIYKKFANGMKGGPNNPLGARALYLYDDAGRDTYLRIHGTNQPGTIGSAVSNGCARLTNEHIKELYGRVEIGSLVYLHPKTAGV